MYGQQLKLFVIVFKSINIFFFFFYDIKVCEIMLKYCVFVCVGGIILKLDLYDVYKFLSPESAFVTEREYMHF